MAVFQVRTGGLAVPVSPFAGASHPLLGGASTHHVAVDRSDPKKAILDDLAPWFEGVRVIGTQVLLVVYIPSIGLGIKGLNGEELVQSEKRTQEAKYQGKAMLVVGMGDAAFAEDASHRWGAVVPKMHDWVAINVGDGWSVELGPKEHGKLRFRVVEDVHIKMILPDPNLIGST